MKIYRLAFGLFISLTFFTVYSSAQTTTAKGNYCGSTYGSGAGTFSFMVGDDRLDLEMEFRDRTVKTARFDLNKLRVGAEFIIKYRRIDGVLYIRSITGTGKRRAVEPCDMET